MKQRALIQLVILFTAPLLLSGSLPQSSTLLQRELADLTKRGFAYRWLNDDLIELTDPVSGMRQLKSLRRLSQADIEAWRAARGIPMLEIDPTAIDTTKFTGWYAYWTTVPLGNSSGSPLVAGDVDRNGCADVYGGYLDTLSPEYEARLYEVDTVGNVFLRYQYVPRPGVSLQLADVDRDSLSEIVWGIGGVVSGYEQASEDSLPIYRKFAHNTLYHNADPGFTGIYIGNLDEDSLTDFLYQGTGPNPLDTNDAISETYVAEYDPALQNFVRVWSTQFYPGSGATGFAVADFDGDARKEFVATHPTGKVYVAENSGDNVYTTTWQDSTPYVNFNYQGSGDIDADGTTEFFAGAVMSNGSWTLMYEADGNNTYSPKFLFHLLSGGIFASPIYTAVDADGDGKLELAVRVGSDLYIFKSNTDNEYFLWYLRREGLMDGVAFYDFDNDGRQDMIISKHDQTSQGEGWLYADVYVATPLVSVREHPYLPIEISIKQNYPNPFNPSTTLSFDLQEPSIVSLVVYDVLGRKIAEPVEGSYGAGTHTATWNAEQQASGVYFARFTVTDGAGMLKFSKVNKLVLMK